MSAWVFDYSLDKITKAIALWSAYDFRRFPTQDEMEIADDIILAYKIWKNMG